MLSLKPCAAFAGPEFMPINAVCRNFPQAMLQVLGGAGGTEQRNTLATLLFCISSGIKKLGQFTHLPANRKVYRGLGTMLLPSQFWVMHGTPEWRGGVERAFMSTTADKSVALSYANGRGTVVEISVGRIQIGGDVSFLSMVTSTLLSPNWLPPGSSDSSPCFPPGPAHCAQTNIGVRALLDRHVLLQLPCCL